MNGLTLTLLGSYQIKVNGEPIRGIASNKGRALLVYLAVEANRPHRRDVLAEMFWPNNPQGVARKSLKQALSNLRKSLGDREALSPFLLIEREEVQFNSGSEYQIDVAEFTTLVKESKIHAHQSVATCRLCIDQLRQAVELYRGDFLEQFSLPDSISFEEWVVVNREALQRQMSDVLRTLVRCSEQNEDYKEACEYGYQLVAFEPWNEENHRALMRLLALCGQRSAALMQYKTCQRILMDELGVELSLETIELYEQIRNGKHELAATQSSEIRAERKSQKVLRPFRFPILAIFVILIFVLAGLFVEFLKPNTNHSIINDPSTSQPMVSNERPTIATDVSPTEAQFIARSVTSETGILQNEYQTLLTLYNQTGGADWRDFDGWLADATPCSWYGVICDGGMITELNLSDNNLSGNIPKELGLLVNLKVLNLRGNQLRGNIPPELWELINLETLSLDGNNLLSGSLPPELGNLINLVNLDISETLISGYIPAELGNLTNLTVLYLADNQLSGSLPPELGNLAKLEDIRLNGNQYLSGPIPPELGNLSNLMYLDLSVNQFSGMLPSELGDLSNLRSLSIRANPLYGPLPMRLSNLNNQLFYYEDTDLCEPPEPAFQEWLDGIYDLQRTGVLC